MLCLQMTDRAIAAFGRAQRLRRRRFSRSPLGARIARLRHRKAFRVARIVRLPEKFQMGNVGAYGNAVRASFSRSCEALVRLFVARAARVCRLSPAPKPLLACDESARRIEPRADSSPSMPIQNRHGLAFAQYRVELPLAGRFGSPPPARRTGPSEALAGSRLTGWPGLCQSWLNMESPPTHRKYAVIRIALPDLCSFLPGLRPLARFL